MSGDADTPVIPIVLQEWPKHGHLKPVEGADYVLSINTMVLVTPELLQALDTLKAALIGAGMKPSTTTAGALFALGGLIGNEIRALINIEEGTHGQRAS